MYRLCFNGYFTAGKRGKQTLYYCYIGISIGVEHRLLYETQIKPELFLNALS